jgi:hypothetical protein
MTEEQLKILMTFLGLTSERQRIDILLLRGYSQEEAKEYSDKLLQIYREYYYGDIK